MNSPLTVAAPAKINLLLHVGRKRADGYHDLESLVAFTTLGDEVSLDHDDGITLSLSGPFGAQLSDCEDNLTLKAAKLFAEKTGTRAGVRIGLRKNLPVASGLGGGSADAAAVLRGLVRLWQLDPHERLLLRIAEQLGADVPVCLIGKTSWMEGKGDRVHPLAPLPKAGVLLANPGVQIPTAQMFAALGSRRGTGMLLPQRPFADIYTLVQFLHDTNNDLEAPAQGAAPVIVDVLREMDRLPHALFARMSGSGATCFALFADEERCAAAALLLSKRHPKWWICETLFSDG